MILEKKIKILLSQLKGLAAMGMSPEIRDIILEVASAIDELRADIDELKTGAKK